jgi:hypothetical protein
VYLLPRIDLNVPFASGMRFAAFCAAIEDCDLIALMVLEDNKEMKQK